MTSRLRSPFAPRRARRRPRAERPLPAAPQRAELARFRADDDAVAAAAEVDVAVGSELARVCGRTQLADQAQLLERGLQLGAEHAPLDLLDRPERRLDGGALPLGAK